MSTGVCYLLVHPELFPANDDDVIGPYLPDGLSLADFDSWYSEGLAAAGAECARRVVLLDAYGRGDLDEAAEDGEPLPWQDWELVSCEPHEVGRVVRRLFKDNSESVIVAGFARHDCVARAVKALEKLGLEVALDETGTLPLSAAGAQAYLEVEDSRIFEPGRT